MVLSLFSTHRKSKLATSAFKYCDWMKVFAASLRVGFCDEWKSVLDQYRCVPETVANRGSVYTSVACTVAFYAKVQQCDAPLFEVLQVAPHDFCNVPIASVNSSSLHHS